MMYWCFQVVKMTKILEGKITLMGELVLIKGEIYHVVIPHCTNM